MKKYFEKILTAILLGTSVLLALSFWLNIRFNFNLLSAKHWNELAQLQVSHTPISITFYISLGIALFIFIAGLYMIFRPRFRKISPALNVSKPKAEIQTTVLDTKPVETPQHMPSTSLQQPPKLNLPKNIAEVAAQRYKNTTNAPKATSAPETERITVYDSALAEIFTENKYVVKPALKIANFTSNLFAIGKDEIVWIGGVDCDINVFKQAIDKLHSIFTDTLEDIPITIYPFILDTKRIYDSDENIAVFHDIEDLRNAISQNPNGIMPEEEEENFNAYSEYIDTIIQYAKNL